MAALDRLKAQKVGKWTRAMIQKYDRVVQLAEDEGHLTLRQSLSEFMWDDQVKFSEWQFEMPNGVDKALFMMTSIERLAGYLTQMLRDGIIFPKDMVRMYLETVEEGRVMLTQSFQLDETFIPPRRWRGQLIQDEVVDGDKIPEVDHSQSESDALDRALRHTDIITISVMQVKPPPKEDPRVTNRAIRADPVYEHNNAYDMHMYGVYPTGRHPKVLNLCWLEALVASILWQKHDEVYEWQGIRLGGYRHDHLARDVLVKTLEIEKKLRQLIPGTPDDEYFFEMVCYHMHLRIVVVDEVSAEQSRVIGDDEDRGDYEVSIFVLESRQRTGVGMHWDAILIWDRYAMRMISRGLREEPLKKCEGCMKKFPESRFHEHLKGPKRKCLKCYKERIPLECYETHKVICKGRLCKDCHKFYNVDECTTHKLTQCPRFEVCEEGDSVEKMRGSRVFIRKPSREGEVDFEKVHAFDIESIDVNGVQTVWMLEIEGIGYFENDFQPGFALKVWTAISMQKGVHYYYAHNASGYDTVLMHGLYHQARREGLKAPKKPMSKCRDGSKITKMVMKWRQGRNEERKVEWDQSMFLDTMKLMPGSLESLAKTLNLPVEYQKKQVVPYKYFTKDFMHYRGVIPKDAFNADVSQVTYDELFKDKWIDFHDLIKEYLHQDVRMLQLILEKLNDVTVEMYENSIIGMMTVGQYAQDTFLRHELFPDGEIPRLNVPQNAMIRGDKELMKDSKYHRQDGIKRPGGVFGGRTEVFHALPVFDLTRGEIKYIDIRSSYPNQMVHHDLPGKCVKFPIFTGDQTRAEAEKLMENPRMYLHGLNGEYLSFVHVSLKMPPLKEGQRRKQAPWLPMHKDEKMMFSYQDRESTYFSEELVRALDPEMGDGWVVDHVYEVQQFQRTQCVQPFMQWAYERKEQWDVQKRFFKGELLNEREQRMMDQLMERYGTREAIENACKSCREFTKVFANSQFGKFLQRLVYDSSILIEDYAALAKIVYDPTIKITNFFKEGDMVDLDYTPVTPIKESACVDKNVNAAIGAAILAWGRIQLTEVARYHDWNVIYMDTDSLIVYIPNGKPMVPPGTSHRVGEELGDWVSETGDEPITTFCCLAPKTYAWECPTSRDEKTRAGAKAKGFSLRAVSNYSKEHPEDVNEQVSVAYFQSIWRRMWEAMDDGKEFEGDQLKSYNMTRELRGTVPGVKSMHVQAKCFRVLLKEMKRKFERDGTSRAYENGDMDIL